MSQESIIIFQGIGATILWMFFYYKFYNKIGMQTVGCSPSKRKMSYKMGVFSFGTSFFFWLFSIIFYFYNKLNHKLILNFSLFKWVLELLVVGIIVNLLSRLAVSFSIRRQDEARSLIVYGSIMGAIVVLVVGCLLIVGFPI